MQPAGFLEIELANTDGRWQAAYESQALATIPDDLAAALEGSPRAKAAFEKLSKSNQYMIYLPLLKALSPTAGAQQLQKVIKLLVSNS